MSMTGEIGILLAYAAGIVIVYILGYIMLAPLKVMLKFFLNSTLGGLALILINIAGEGFDIHIPLNLLSAMISGILGVPGVILLYILEQL